MASVTISGGYFPARSFHPIHFISLFLLPTLLTTITFTNIFKCFSLDQIIWKMSKRGHEKFYDVIKDIEKVNCLIRKINWWPYACAERCKKSGKGFFAGLQDINMIKGGEASGLVHYLLEQRRAIIWALGRNPSILLMQCIAELRRTVLEFATFSWTAVSPKFPLFSELQQKHWFGLNNRATTRIVRLLCTCVLLLVILKVNK